MKVVLRPHYYQILVTSTKVLTLFIPAPVRLGVPLAALLILLGLPQSASPETDQGAIRTKNIVLIDSAEGLRRLTIPILYSRSGSQWEVYPPARIRIATFLRRPNGRPAQALPDALLVVLYLVFQKFSTPIVVVDGAELPGLHPAHPPGRAVDFRLDGLDLSALWNYCRSLPGIGIGHQPPANGKDGFIHIEAGSNGCWSVDSKGFGSTCAQKEPQAVMPDGSHAAAGIPITRFEHIVFIDNHANGRQLSIPILFNDNGGSSFGVWPPAREKIADFLRDQLFDVALPIEDRLLINLVLVYKHYGKPIRVVSGARFHNTVQDSRHPRGQAIDFQLDSIDMEQVWIWCRATFKNVGVGYYPPYGTRSAFVHLDVREKPGCWVDPPKADGPRCNNNR